MRVFLLAILISLTFVSTPLLSYNRLHNRISVPVTELPVSTDGESQYINVAPGEFLGKESEMVWLQQFNTKVTLRSSSGVNYGGVYVRIYNSAGIKIIGFLCEKPWLLLHLHEGYYHIIAVDRHHVQQIKQFRVPGEDLSETEPTTPHLIQVRLTWPKEQVGY